MACACRGRNKNKFVWTSEDGKLQIVYGSELEAKAKVLRKGGSYVRQGS